MECTQGVGGSLVIETVEGTGGEVSEGCQGHLKMAIRRLVLTLPTPQISESRAQS